MSFGPVPFQGRVVDPPRALSAVVRDGAFSVANVNPFSYLVRIRGNKNRQPIHITVLPGQTVSVHIAKQ